MLVKRQVYIYVVTAYNAYTNGTSVGAIAATNSNLTIYEGYGVSLLFGNFFSPRIWNGTIFYSVNTVNTDNRDKSSIQYRPVAQTVNPDLFQTNIPVCESNAMAFRHECRW